MTCQFYTILAVLLVVSDGIRTFYFNAQTEHLGTSLLFIFLVLIDILKELRRK